MVKRIGNSRPAALVGVKMWLSWPLRLSTPDIDRYNGLSMQNGAHGKVELCALSNNLYIGYRHNFYER